MRTVPLLVTILALPLHAQSAPENPGPRAPGFRTLTVAGVPGGNAQVALRVHYPALAAGTDQPFDPSAAPCPVVVFGHGFSLSAALYDSLYRHLATHGFVAVGVATEEGLFTGNLPRFVKDQHAAVLGLRAASADPSSPFAGAVAADVRANAAGHSFGGAAALVAAAERPDLFRSVTSMAATATSPQGVDILAAVRALSVPALHLGASNDSIVPPAQNLDPIHAATPTTRRLVEIAGGNHNAFHEAWGPDRLLEPPGTISIAEQQRLIRRYWTAFCEWTLRTEVRDLDVLLGPTAIADPGLSRQATTLREAWLFASGDASPGGALGVHPARAPGELGLTLIAPGTGSLPTPFGTLGLDASFVVAGYTTAGSTSFGTLPIPLPPDPSLSGARAFFQALLWDGALGELTNVLEVVVD